MFEKKAWPKKLLITLGGSEHYRTFQNASKNVKRFQEQWLKQTLAENKLTSFGKDHHFDKIRTIDEFRKAVPVSDFEYHRPYIDRMCNGEADVLFPGKAVFYNTTSGTTSKPKLIPVSKKYFTHSYRRLSRLWFYSVLKDNPRIFDGASLSAVAREVEGYVDDGTPYGAISGSVYRNIPPILKQTYSNPYPVICIRDYLKKYYAMMRFALGRNITYIICPSPSNILQLNTTVVENQQDLIRDIHDGTLRGDVLAQVEPEYIDELKQSMKPDPERARQLERLFSKYGQGIKPAHYWPQCACVNLWKEGNFARILPKIVDYFPSDCSLRSFGYQASEARAGLVFGNDWNYSALAVQEYHFEFIEEHVSFQNNSFPETLLAHELETGKRYYLLFSNGSGLYRYNINDIVEVVGWYNGVPLFTFIQKGEGVTSLTGEKLSEVQVVQAVDEAAAGLSLRIPFFTLFCDEENLCYRLFVEFEAGVEGSLKNAFLKAFDRVTKKLNPEYEIKRESNRLAEPYLEELVPDSSEKFKEILIQQGLARDGQYKESFLAKKKIVGKILDSIVTEYTQETETECV